MNAPWISFVGDDFTGSTDALESLAMAGLRTRLFTPDLSANLSTDLFGDLSDLDAIGIATPARAMTAQAARLALAPLFQMLQRLRGPIVHYKVCSTFDSSPTIGSIGAALDLGAETFGTRCVPIVVGAPALGRYCVFGNLFARAGDGPPVRIDRHPTMSRHPVTPMREADLRIHLSHQTHKPIGLFDCLQLNLPEDETAMAFDKAMTGADQALLIDLLQESHLPVIGALLSRSVMGPKPAFVVGSSGVEAALVAFWRETGRIAGAAHFPPICGVGPMLAVCGSCSPVTAGQIEYAIAHGFTEIPIDPGRADEQDSARDAIHALREGQSIVIHSAATRGRLSDAALIARIGPRLGRLVDRVLQEFPVRRVLVAGGDTSGQIARALGIASLEMVAPLTAGAPLCRATAPGRSAHDVQFIFKGGQIGPIDLFCSARDGAAACESPPCVNAASN